MRKDLSWVFVASGRELFLYTSYGRKKNTRFESGRQPRIYLATWLYLCRWNSASSSPNLPREIWRSSRYLVRRFRFLIGRGALCCFRKGLDKWEPWNIMVIKHFRPLYEGKSGEIKATFATWWTFKPHQPRVYWLLWYKWNNRGRFASTLDPSITASWRWRFRNSRELDKVIQSSFGYSRVTKRMFFGHCFVRHGVRL